MDAGLIFCYNRTDKKRWVGYARLGLQCPHSFMTLKFATFAKACADLKDKKPIYTISGFVSSPPSVAIWEQSVVCKARRLGRDGSMRPTTLKSPKLKFMVSTSKIVIHIL